MNQVYKLIINRKYEALLFSLLLMIFGGLIVPSKLEDLFESILVIQNVVVGYIIFQSDSKKMKYGISIFLFIIICLETLNHLYSQEYLKILMFSAFIIYFIPISIKVYIAIYTTKEVGVKMVSAVFCGFIMMVTIWSFLFLIIESIYPSSFSNLGSESELFPNIQYFSFITSLTIGYGDIVPLTLMSKKAVMLLSIIGNFYTVFITGIIIGKFINRDSK
jgi:hypothetical protein